jgi:hypothetical protein
MTESPNKHMQRARTHKVLGRGRPSLVRCSAPRARVLTGQRAGDDVGRKASFTRHRTSCSCLGGAKC